MKINPSINQNVQGTSTSSAESLKKSQDTSKVDRAKQVEEARLKARTPDASSVKAEVSSRAKESAQAHAVAATTPDVREERVAALKAKIADGSYKIDADKIADRMVSEHASSL